MKIKEENVSAFVWILLAIILFLSSFFLIYANEVILEKNDKKTRIQKIIYYRKLYFWESLQKMENYRNSIVLESNDASAATKWVIRLIWILWLWFSLSLFMFQIFPDREKEILVKKSFLYSFIWVILFIILLKIYLFYLAWWFKFDFSWFYNRPWWNWLSFSDKFIIIFIIVLIFIWVWALYNKKQKKDEE